MKTNKEIRFEVLEEIRKVIEKKKHTYNNYPFLKELRKDGWIVNSSNKHILIEVWKKALAMKDENYEKQLAEKDAEHLKFLKVIEKKDPVIMWNKIKEEISRRESEGKEKLK